MKDELHKHIVEGLAGELDGNLFEHCAVDLLQPLYKTMTPIKGGGDDGRDGLFIDVGGIPTPLVATVGVDVKGNLRRNLKQYKDKGHKGGRAILATSQKITPSERNKLEEVAKEKGFTLIQVHERSDFALRLYSNKTWLKKLLNLESNQQALSINPVSSRPVFSLSVRGREGVRKWLEGTEGDLLVVGQPGSGKTFVIRDFVIDNEGLFVVSDNRDEITAEIRDKKPKYIVLDDAHTNIPLLRALRQIREDTGAGFKIISTGWISYKVQLQNELMITDGETLELELLGRDTILEIIKDCGVTWYEPLQAQIVRQAEGKPGLAATLCQLSLRGNAQEVYIGDALGKHLEALFAKEIGAEALDVLAVIALGGDSGISIKNIATIVELSQLKVQGLTAQLAFGGVVTELPSGNLTVRPKSLRYYLAKQRFFNGPSSVDPTPYLALYDKFPDVVEVMLHAGLRGGKVNKEELYVLVEKTGYPKLFAGFAAFGKDEAAKVIKEHPDEALNSPREFLQYLPEAILPLMLEKAIGDERELHSTTEHPMRVIQDWSKDLDPNRGEALPRKKALLKVLKDWKSRGKDEKVLAQALVFAFNPRIEQHRNDPGSGMTITFISGHLSASDMRATLDEWPSSKKLIADLPDEAWYHMVELVREWAYERSFNNYKLSDDQLKVLNEGAAQILTDLVEMSAEQPGIQSQLKTIAHHLKLKPKFTASREYDIIFPHENDRRAMQENFDKQMIPVEKLAKEYAVQNPAEVIRKIERLNKQALLSKKTWPNHTHIIAAKIAGQVENVDEWATASVSESTNPTLSLPFLSALQVKDPAKAQPLLLKALSDERHRHSAAEVILRRPFNDDELWNALYPELSEHVRTAEILVIQQAVDDETRRRLLRYPDGDVGLMVADSTVHVLEGNIPPDLIDDWENALIKYKFGKRSHNEYHVSNALRQHPDSIPKWLAAKVAEKPTSYFDSFSHEAGELIQHLTNEQKAEIIDSLVANERSQEIAASLVGSSPKRFARLLANKKTRRYQLGCLGGISGERWVMFAELALAAGRDEAEIASASASFNDSWSGPASGHYTLRQMQYDAGLKSSNPRIVSIATKCVAFYEPLIERALKEEKREEIYGIDGD